MFGVLKLGKLGASMKKAGFNPRTLFSASEPGAWYDPNDMSTLSQDSAGTTPVTAVEQPVGRMLDKSGRGNHAIQATTTKRPVLSRRVNLFTKTENFSDIAWAANLFGNWTANNARSAATAPSPLGDFTASKLSFTAPQGSVSVGQRAAVSPGVYRAALWMRLTPGVSSLGSASMHIGVANGSSGAFVAPYSNIQNIGPQLTESWKLFTLGHTVPASGVNQIELLINKASSADSCSVDVWGASLTLATDAHLPYQWVNTATDYDANPAKFPAYLRFDGVDDALQTGNIDFTGTDKMTVWAGITKLSDAANGMLLEHSADWNLNNGTFLVVASGPSGNFEFGSRGTSQVVTLRSGFRAPINANLSISANIGGPSLANRINGVPSTVSTSLQGTGNYGNYPLYIGARAGTSLYFNCRLYGLIVRGAQSTLSQIEATELYMKKKVGIA